MKWTIKPARQGDFLLIVGQQVWGKGETLEAAKKAVSYPSCLKKGFHVYSVHPDSYVNEYGGMVYPRDHAPLHTATYE